jgi:hypothetical protein
MKNRHVFHFDHSLASNKGLEPNSGYIAPLSTDQYKFGLKSVKMQPKTTNMLTANQSSIETNVTGLNSYSSTITRDTTEYWDGVASLKIHTDNAAALEGFYTSKTVTTPSLTYTASAWVKGTGTVQMSISERTAADASLGSTNGTVVTLTSSWQRISVIRTFGATGEGCRCMVLTDAQQHIDFYVDGIQLEQGNDLTDWIVGGSSRDAGQLSYDVIPSGDFTIYDHIYPLSNWNSTYNNNSTGGETTHEYIFKWGSTTGGLWAYHDRDAGQVKLVGFEAAAASTVSYTHTLTTSTWLNYAVVLDRSASVADFYVNGSTVGQVSLVGSTLNTLSLYRSSAYGYIGYHDEILIRPMYSTASEIKSWYDSSRAFPNIPPDRIITTKLYIIDAAGTAQDLSSYLTRVEWSSGDVSSVGTGNSGSDSAIRECTFTIHDDGTTNSFQPKDQNSSWNQIGGVYYPLLWPNREFYLWVAVTEPGETISTGTDGEYYEVFRGKLGDSIQCDGHTVTCQSRDLSKTLMDTYIETPTGYSYTSASPGIAENVISQIIYDNIGSNAPMVAVENEGSSNLIVNPSFETNSTTYPGLAQSWLPTSTVSFTYSQSTAYIWDGSYSQLITSAASTATRAIYQDVTVSSGNEYMFRCAALVSSLSSTTAYLNFNMRFLDASTATVENNNFSIDVTDTALHQRSVYGVAPETAVKARMRIGIVNGGSAYIDAAEFRTCNLSGFSITQYKTEMESVWDAIQKIPMQCGWFLGYKWHEPQGTYTSDSFRLMHIEPPRTNGSTSPDIEVDADWDFYKQDLDITDKDVRNAFKITYISTTGTSTTATDTSTASIDSYGRRYCEFSEEATSLINTSAEATAFLAAAKSDMKDLIGVTKLDMPLYPEMDVFKGIVVTDPNYLISTSTDFYGVESFRNTIEYSDSPDGSRFRTEVIASGQIKGGKRKYLAKETRPGSDQVTKSAMTQNSVTKSAANSEVITGYAFDGISYHTFFDSIDGFFSTYSGTGSSVQLSNQNSYPAGSYTKLVITAGASSGAYAQLAKIPIYSLVSPNFDKKIHFKLPLSINSTQKRTDYYITGPVNNNHIGFKLIDGALYASVSTGSAAEVNTDLSTSLSASTLYVLEYTYDPGVSADFYVNGLLKATVKSNLPSGVSNFTEPLNIYVTASSGTLTKVETCEFIYTQEP